MTVFFFSTLAVGAGIHTSGGKNQASSCIEQAMQRFSSPHGCVWVHGLVDLRERIEQAPCCSFPECRVCRMPPLIEHIGNLRGRDRLAIHRPDHEIMGFEVIHPMAFVGLDSLIEVVETITQLSNRPCREVPEVSHGIACVLATDSYFS
jgi:hypothetical protein